MFWIRPHLTFANVVSVLALFVALGGTATAALVVSGRNVQDNSLTGADVKNSSLTSLDVKGGSLLANDFKPGQLPTGTVGPTGPAGPPGNQGPKGDQGAKGDPATKLFAHVLDTGTLTSSSSGAIAATRTQTGIYAVVFNRDLAGCIAVVQIGFVSLDTGGSILPDTIGHTEITSNVVNVYFQRAANAAAADANFNVAVFC